ncbi:MAG: rane protein of unknown function [Candidatus Saccharibacteria bacterium]|jgi:membrane protease YdiL (CAAX protease family)|nr:rane protein of unknown function [Candidatus Saccharibacteria bacterium]
MPEDKPAHSHRGRRGPEFLHVPWTLTDLLVMVISWIGIQVVLILALGFLAGYVPAIREFLDGVKDGEILNLFALDMVDALAGLGVIWLFLRKYRVGIRSLGWRPFDPGKAILYIVGILLFFVVASALLLWLVSKLVPGFNADQAQDNAFIESAAQNRNLALIALVLIPPILEETIFRGFMFPVMARNWGVVWGAIGSSVVFGLAHFQANISLYTFLLGLLLCFMYVKLKSIWPGIALHMLNNYLAFLALSAK